MYPTLTTEEAKARLRTVPYFKDSNFFKFFWKKIPEIMKNNFYDVLMIFFLIKAWQL